ncbi:hypothetical protein QTJ16_005577 [Diplocarpon rosae]|uniref:Enoyl reductase (ER) domain-containing protein n=1 Tax=Diplocarpon rosae TaxID=946125 RepID=A0AAD9SV79_9HELO|nr:hypothetical protein QTJ16_005577 [Diplocarpon rosae]PBP18933.1 alcohol dehydrogenase [Diplocarpon rosae]
MVEFTVFKGSKEGRIVQSQSKKEIKADEILIKVTHSGLCGTDEHFKCVDMVLGHEGVGVVEEIGQAVTTYHKGDSVGWGYQHDSCNHCKQCLTGHETLCPQRAMYGYKDLDQGSFAYYAVWKADYVFKLPDSIPRQYAAPLNCGGATVFNALRSFSVTPLSRVGIIGIGGLGHLAIQFASKMGCHVTVFSSTNRKRDEALQLGAHEFVATKGVESLEVSDKIDQLLICSSIMPDWKQFLPIMAPAGTLYPLTVAGGDLTIPYPPLLEQQLNIQGSLVAARSVHNEMLGFAALHQIRPVIEEFPMTVEGIETSMKKLAEGQMRYRGVLVAP